MSEQADATTEDKTSLQEAEAITGFDLSRVFSLLSLIIGLVALGLISALFLNVDRRLENIEKSDMAVHKVLEDKVASLHADASKKAAALPAASPNSAKNLLVGSEISRTLYLMRYVSGDPDFSEAARQGAAQVSANAEALLKELQAAR